METQLVLCFLLFVTVTVNVFFLGCDTTQRLNSDGYIKVIAHGSPTKSCHVPLHFLSTLQRFRHLSLHVWLFLSQCQQSASLISISSQQAAFFEFRCSNSLRFVCFFFFCFSFSLTESLELIFFPFIFSKLIYSRARLKPQPSLFLQHVYSRWRRATFILKSINQSFFVYIAAFKTNQCHAKCFSSWLTNTGRKGQARKRTWRRMHTVIIIRKAHRWSLVLISVQNIIHWSSVSCMWTPRAQWEYERGSVAAGCPSCCWRERDKCVSCDFSQELWETLGSPVL